MSKKRVALSPERLINFLSKNSYTVLTVYTVDSAIRFIEIKTPKFQKNFIVYVPQKYNMPFGSLAGITQIPIATTQTRTTRQSQHLEKIGEVLTGESSIVSISSNMICYYAMTLSGTSVTEKYKIVNDDFLDDIGGPEDNDGSVSTPVQKIIKDASALFNKMDAGDIQSEPQEEEDEYVEDGDDLEGEYIEDEIENVEDTETLEHDVEDQDIELEFEDDQGESVSDVSEFIDTTATTLDVTEGDEDTKIIEKSQTIGEDDIILGIIYYAMDLTALYKSVGVPAVDLEKQIIASYDIINENENNIRSDRISEIEDLTENIIEKIKQDFTKFSEEEKRLNTQLKMLVTVCEKTEGLQIKVKTDVKKYGDSKGDIEKIYTQTRSTIHDLNVELLKHRDTYDDLVDTTIIMLNEVLLGT